MGARARRLRASATRGATRLSSPRARRARPRLVVALAPLVGGARVRDDRAARVDAERARARRARCGSRPRGRSRRARRTSRARRSRRRAAPARGRRGSASRRASARPSSSRAGRPRGGDRRGPGPRARRPVTSDTRWWTVANDSTARSEGTATLPVSHTRPRSWRTRSTIITFSARSFSERASSRASAASLAGSAPRGRVPLIGPALDAPIGVEAEEALRRRDSTPRPRGARATRRTAPGSTRGASR